MKLFALSLLLSSTLFGSTVYSYEPIGTNGKNSMTSKYYNREISSQEYVDSLIGPINRPSASYKGELKPNKYGQGYNYSDISGSYVEYRPNRAGGWDVSGN